MKIKKYQNPDASIETRLVPRSKETFSSFWSKRQDPSGEFDIIQESNSNGKNRIDTIYYNPKGTFSYLRDLAAKKVKGGTSIIREFRDKNGKISQDTIFAPIDYYNWTNYNEYIPIKQD